jgi:hypothetical protein
MRGFAEQRSDFIPVETGGLDRARFAPDHRRRLSAPAFRTFLAIADLWKLERSRRARSTRKHFAF